MIYIKAVLIYFLFFLLLTFIIVYKKLITKNFKKLYITERKLLVKIPFYFSWLHALSPKLIKAFLISSKNNKIEKQLPEFIENIISSLSGGVSVFLYFTQSIDLLKQPLKNEIKLFLLIAAKLGNIKALDYIIKNNTYSNVFLKLFWIILQEGNKTGVGLVANFKTLHQTLYTRISIKNKINVQLAQVRVQMIIGTVFPYFLLLLLNVIYPSLLEPVFKEKIGKAIIFFALFIHAIGVYVFIIISKFDIKKDLSVSLFIEYISLSLKSGVSVIYSIKNFCSTKLLDKKLSSAISNTKSTLEVLTILKTHSDNEIKLLANVLDKGYSLGIPISEDLSAKANNILEKLEHKAGLFAQTVAVKALIPMLFFIFPSTYLLILSPLILELMNFNG